MAINNPLSPRLIYNEINGTSHGANATIGSGITMSSLRTASVTFNNVKAAPDTMSEWNGYTHAQSMGTINYAIRISASSSTWGLNQAATHIQYEDSAYSEGAVLIWRTHDGSNTYIKAKALNHPLGSPSVRQYSTPAGVTTALGYTSGGTTMITIPVSDVTINASVVGLTGTSINYSPYGPAGNTSPYNEYDDMASVTGATLLVCRGAESAEADAGSAEISAATFKVVLTASKTGYTTTVLDAGVSGAGIIVHSVNDAEGIGGE